MGDLINFLCANQERLHHRTRTSSTTAGSIRDCSEAHQRDSKRSAGNTLAIGPLPALPGTDPARSGGIIGWGARHRKQFVSSAGQRVLRLDGRPLARQATQAFDQDDPSQFAYPSLRRLCRDGDGLAGAPRFSRFGKIDALIGNAGIWRALDFESGDSVRKGRSWR